MKSIICNNKEVSINWDKVVNIKDKGNLQLNSNYTSLAPYARKIEKIISHHDVTTSAHMCYKIFAKKDSRKSSHFIIDNDGTIYQFLDPCHKAWHASGANTYSIGIDISTAYKLKYQDYYVNKYGEPKPVVEGFKVHGKELEPFLGYYPQQIEAYKELLISLIKYYKIPVRFPKDERGNYLGGYSPTAYKFKGLLCHFHVDRGKIDPAGINLEEIVKDLRARFAENKELSNTQEQE